LKFEQLNLLQKGDTGFIDEFFTKNVSCSIHADGKCLPFPKYI